MQIIVIDITELLDALYDNKTILYLYHFSKYGNSFIIPYKKAKNIYNKLKLTLDYFDIQNQIGSENNTKFKNSIIENLLKEYNINFIYGAP